ncbi:MAG: relaxase domain-containing protein [Verrucomicrobia bacterium]|nr:relaxase domain-containing protein [Verrucomicrobiota bacterium]
MLSQKTQTNVKNAKSYFQEHLATENYYTEAERVRGEWIGNAAQMLDLSGTVGLDDFVALCESKHPQTRKRLTQRLNLRRRDNAGTEAEGGAANRRVFFDFTFSPPKSVSIVALVKGDERIVQAHHQAAEVAVRELEQFAGTRIRQDGNNSDRATGNMIAALFQHDTSRALDPHLHTHCIIFNATHDNTEKRWKALQNAEMLAAQKYVENVYYHELARVIQQLGYATENSSRGDFRIVGVSSELCNKFSKRHRQIDEQTREFLARNPRKTFGNVNEIRELLAHKLRSRKEHDVAPERLRALWNGQLSNEERTALETLGLAQIPSRLITIEAAVSWAEEHLFERRSVVHEQEIWRHALEFARGSGLTIQELKRETASRDYVRQTDGKLTRKDVLGREWQIVKTAMEGMGQFEAFSNSSSVCDDLAADQQKALTQILASRDLVTLFRGSAGTGKSHVLRTLQATLAADGRTTVLLAPQRQQVIDLEQNGLSNGKTVAEFLQRRTMPQGAVIIVDEAGQVGARQLLSLLQRAKASEGRVILSGDTRQHGPVEASDALRAIERYSGLRPAELNSVRRQDPKRAKTKDERKRIQAYQHAVRAAANGDTATSFATLDKIGAVVESNTRAINEELLRSYLALSAQGQSVLAVSQTRTEVRALNESIRAGLKRQGRIASEEHAVTALEPVDLTNAEKLDRRFYPDDHTIVISRRVAGCERGTQGRVLLANEREVIFEAGGKIRAIKSRHVKYFAICRPQPLQLSSGDRLRLRANAKAKDGESLANGEVVTVHMIRGSGEIVLADGRILPAEYRQFSRGYAVTSYGSQGKTVDHVLLRDSAVRAATNAQQWYVSISRGRRSVRIFTPDKAALRAHILGTGSRPLALTLREKRVQQIAIDRGLLRKLRRGRAFGRALCLLPPQTSNIAQTRRPQIAT